MTPIDIAKEFIKMVDERSYIGEPPVGVYEVCKELLRVSDELEDTKIEHHTKDFVWAMNQVHWLRVGIMEAQRMLEVMRFNLYGSEIKEVRDWLDKYGIGG